MKKNNSLLFKDAEEKNNYRGNPFYLYLLLVVFFPLGLLELRRAKKPGVKFRRTYYLFCAMFFSAIVLCFLAAVHEKHYGINLYIETVNLEIGQSVPVQIRTEKSGFNYGDYEYLTDGSDSIEFIDGLITAKSPGSCEIYVRAGKIESNRVAVYVTGGETDYSRTVYISAYGKAYHYSSTCSNIKEPISLTLHEAQEQGYRLCKKCASVEQDAA